MRTNPNRTQIQRRYLCPPGGLALFALGPLLFAWRIVNRRTGYRFRRAIRLDNRLRFAGRQRSLNLLARRERLIDAALMLWTVSVRLAGR